MITKTNYTVNLTSQIQLPNVDYINEIAIEKNFSLGKSFLDPPKILSDLYFLFQKENIDPMGFDLKKFIFTSKYIEEKVLEREMDNDERAYYNYTLLFLKQIEFGNVLGITPLDKSLNVLMYLATLSDELNKNNADQYDGRSNPEGSGKIDIKDEESLAKAIQELSRGVKGNGVEVPGEGGEGKGNNKDISTEITKCVRDHLYDLTPSIANVYGKKRPADVPINKRILADIKIKGYLENSVGLNTALDTKKVKNNDSHEKSTFRMETADEITKVRKSAMMMENFDDKFIKKELNIQNKVKPEEKKQMLYLLLDDSGSMCCLHKQTYVRAVLLNRLESVVDGKSELKFALYESQRYGFRNIVTKLDSKELFREISLRRPSGGGTHIGRILQETINEIASDNITGYHDPEIVIVCDGDDHVDPSKIDFKDVRINVILLGTENQNLKKVAELTKGFYTCEKLYNR